MSILSGAIGTMKKKAASFIQYQVPGTFNSKTYWVTGLANEPNAGASGLAWGSYGTVRNITSTTDGFANSTTLAGFGQAAHPAAYYCRNLTLGGYSWFLPAKDELNHIYLNIAAAGKLLDASGIHADRFTSVYGYSSSTESSGTYMWMQIMSSGVQRDVGGKSTAYRIRACRKV